jgi:hypothetical protein
MFGSSAGARGAATAEPLVRDRPAAAGTTTPTEDLVTAILAACVVVGATSDAWAHANLLGQLQREGFFTPWHGLLYGGFAASAVWTLSLAFRRRHRVARWWLDGWPVGYRLGAVGVLVFFVAGLGDMVWHTIFGVEASLAASLSPTHLLLVCGAALMFTSPLRSWWAAGGGGGRRAVAGVLSIALTTTLASMLLQYASAFGLASAVETYDLVVATPGSFNASLGLDSYMITTVLLVIPLLLVHRRSPTPWIVTALVVPVSLFPVILHNLANPQLGGALAAIIGAAIVDWILVRLDDARGVEAALRLPLAGVVFAVVVWPAHLLGLQLSGGIQWPVELWTGVVVLTAAAAGALGTLATTTPVLTTSRGVEEPSGTEVSSRVP